MENKHTVYVRESRRFFTSIGICPRCGKNKLFGDEKSCPECRAKESQYESKRWVEQHDKRLSDRKKSFNRLYHERKQQGICVKCGKRNADEKHVTCEWCRKKENAKAVERRNRKKDFDKNIN